MDRDVIVPEADDATDQIQLDRSRNAARLGTSGDNEAADRHSNKIGA
jgi:hypothetical protein